MESLSQINESLDAANRSLDRAARQFADVRLEPVAQNLQAIGRVLVEIFELQYQLFALKPELLPAMLREPAANQEAAFRVAMGRVAAFEAAGAVPTAIGVLDLFITYQTSEHHLVLAKAERARLQNVRAV